MILTQTHLAGKLPALQTQLEARVLLLKVWSGRMGVTWGLVGASWCSPETYSSKIWI